jgi:ATPase family associated with various cellular activities (AAA)
MAKTQTSTITNDRTVTIAEARTRVMRCLNKQRPVFLWGPPGIGKSDLVAQIARELNGAIIDFRLSIRQPTDIMGIPFFNKEKGVMDWAPPIDLPSAEFAAQYPVVVLFLDELNAAAPAVQAAAYQLVLNRRVGQYQLPDNVVMVAAGNRESDKGVTYRMPAPLANRFVHLELRQDFQTWCDWAVLNQIHQDVVGYLTFAKGDLFDFSTQSSSRAFATPRSWTFLSDLLGDDDITSAELADLAAGTVGEGIAVKFMAHRKIAADLPDPTSILNGKVKTLKTTEISAKYSLVVSMCYELREAHLNKVSDDQFHDMADNFLQFMMDNFETEMAVWGARMALVTYNLPFRPTKLKNFNKFHQTYGKFVVGTVGTK